MDFTDEMLQNFGEEILSLKFFEFEIVSKGYN